MCAVVSIYALTVDSSRSFSLNFPMHKMVSLLNRGSRRI